MVKNIKIKKEILIIGIIVLLLVGGIVGVNLFPKTRAIQPNRALNEIAEYICENTNNFAFRNIDNVVKAGIFKISDAQTGEFKRWDIQCTDSEGDFISSPLINALE